MGKDTQLPAEVLSIDIRQSIHESAVNYHNTTVGKNDILAYIAGATEYATKWFYTFEENGRLATTLADYVEKEKEYAIKLHQVEQEIERRNKLLEFNHKLSMRLNMIGCSEATQEESWQDYKRRNNL